MKKMTPVCIQWTDSARDMTSWQWADKARSPKPSSCISVGMLLENKKKHKTIVQSVSDGSILYRLTIPTCSIKKMTVLK